MVLVRIVYGNKAGKEKYTKVSFAVSNLETRFFCRRKFFAVLVVKCEKVSLVICRDFEAFLRNFYVRPRTF